MKFSREKLTRMINEEYDRIQKEAENAHNDPNSAEKQLEWMAMSLEKINKAVQNETELTPQMHELIHTAANLLDTVADSLTFNELVAKHVGQGGKKQG